MILHEQFITKAKEHKNRMAIIDCSAARRITYSKALVTALIFANRFKSYRDQYIGVMVPTSAAAYLTIVGILMAGKTPVILNYSTGAEQNCQYAKEMIGFETIITSKALLEKVGAPISEGMVLLEEFAQSISPLEKLNALLQSLLPAKWLLRRFPTTQIEDTAAILFTSGSESNPKAVMLSHKNLNSNLKGIIQVYRLDEHHIVFNALPIFHVFGLTTGFWLPLVLGAPVVTYANPLEFKKIPACIRKEKATLIAGTPTFFADYLRAAKPGDFASVQLMVVGADKTPDWLREAYRKEHQIELLEGYGATETSPVIATNTPEANRPGSVGKPLPGVRVKITDVATGEELPPGKEGKIMVKGDLVMKGYYGDLENTYLRIRDGWYDTGDMGVLDEDGYLWHRGRLKRFVKIGGEMISLVRTEIELSKLLPDGVECCVVDVPDRRKGARLVAAVTAEVDKEKLTKELSSHLPSIAVPKIFVVLDELPKMGSGKIDFRSVTKKVRQMIEKGADKPL